MSTDPGTFRTTLEWAGEEVELCYDIDRWDGIVIQGVLVDDRWIDPDTFGITAVEYWTGEIEADLREQARLESA